MVDMPTLAGPIGVTDAGELERVGEVERNSTPFMELGATGLKRAGGYLDEEFLPQLRGRKAIQVYREMADNSSVIGAMNLAMRMLTSNVDWSAAPAGPSRDAGNAARFLESNLEDMSHSFQHHVEEAIGACTYGWSWHEIVFKRRGGLWTGDGATRSKFSDDLYGIRKLPIRGQETLQRWIFDEHDDVRAMVQLAPPYYRTTTLPITKSLLYRWGVHKASPEGTSMLRNAYRPWFYLKRFEEFESIGVERDLAGLPKIGVPFSYLKAKPGSQDYKTVESLKRMVRSIRRNEQEGVVFPLDYDDETKQPNFTFDLLGSGGARQFSTQVIIERLKQEILMTVLADWIMVGHTDTGTYNLHVDKTGIYKTTLNAITQHMIADVLNRHLVPRLFMINGWRPPELPKLVASDVDVPDLAQLAQFLAATAGIGVPWTNDGELEKFLRSAAGMPKLADADQAKRRRTARITEATGYATAQTEYLAARSQLAQAQVEEAQTAAGVPSIEDRMAMATGQAQQWQAGQDAADQARAGEQQDTTHSLDVASRLQELARGYAEANGDGKPTGKSRSGATPARGGSK